jgi:hypothetical protein
MTSPSTRRRSIDATMSLMKGVLEGDELTEDEIARRLNGMDLK